jgi:hypothetical protein
MRFESHAEQVFEGIDAAFEAAVLDTRDEAERIARQHSRTGKFAGSIEASEVEQVGGRLEARIGSPLVSARAKEKGAFIQAKNKPTLIIKTKDGWRRPKQVRLVPHPAVTPAGRKFGEFMAERLRQTIG